ncbi:hypothetical protein KUTeg_024079 [Tegillarca granosa]|uniref:Uncharacterized protein n=1 Tax=Tegillarca granosa TaxID=220873 RepID=A0ABQ9DWA7_TEGGR|nr:hypothetical protein KUTeg_024079 [Tegillarca granosa]
MSFWRQAGLSYIQFSAVCARAVRQALKPELREKALVRDQSFIKSTKWADGKPSKRVTNTNMNT